MKREGWGGLLRTPAVRILAIAVVIVLIAVSAGRAWRDMQVPQTIQVPGVPYSQQSELDYQVYLEPSTLYGTLPLSSAEPAAEDEEETEADEEEEIRHQFFRSIVSDFNMIFTYGFDPGSPVVRKEITAEVIIYAEDPGVWETDLRRYFTNSSETPTVVDFEFDADELDLSIERIEDEIGINAGDVNYRIEAVVNVVAETTQGDVVGDTYVHELGVEFDGKTIELFEPLSRHQQVRGRPGWLHSSRYDYEVFLEWNELFDEPVLRSMDLAGEEEEEEEVSPSPVEEGPPLSVLGPGHTYFPNLVDHIDATFTYSFDSVAPVQERTHSVEVKATIGNAESWQKTLSLVPLHEETDDFVIEFPIDIDYYSAVIAAIAAETGLKASTHDIRVNVNVTTTATTPQGTIEESMSQVLQGSLSSSSLSFEDSSLRQTRQGQIGGGTMPNPDAIPGGWQTPWLFGVGAGVVGLGLLLWREFQLRNVALSPSEKEFARIQKKYKEVLVGVSHLPPHGASDIFITLQSVDELARVADDAVKPVLHLAENGRHTYVVYDGLVRYEYSLEHRPAEGGEPSTSAPDAA